MPFKDWISAKRKNFKSSNLLETNQTITTILFCSKPLLITAFKIFVNSDFDTYFSDFDFLKIK